MSDDGNRRIIAIRVPEANDEDLPRIISSLSIPQMRWNMDALALWINTNPNQQLPTFPLLYE